MFPLGFQRRKLIGQWQHRVMFPFGRHLKRKFIDQWLQTVALSNTHTEQRQPQSIAEGLGAGGVEECKGFSPPTVPKTNAASPQVPLGSLVSNTPTATGSRNRLQRGRQFCKLSTKKRRDLQVISRPVTGHKTISINITGVLLLYHAPVLLCR